MALEIDAQAYATILRGPIADPGPEMLMLLPKEQIAQIKLRQLDMQIKVIEAHVELLQMQRDALAKEYGIS